MPQLMKTLSYYWHNTLFLSGLIFFVATPVLAQDIGKLSAQSVWPNPHWINPDTFRGPGFYFSLVKIAVCLIIFLLWVV